MNTLWNKTKIVKKPAAIVALTAIAVTTAPAWLGCTADVEDDRRVGVERDRVTIVADAAPYNTPGPQSNDAGVLGTQDNPFTLIVMQLFADATHQDYWAVDPIGNYGTFHQRMVLNGITQFKWLKCGAVGAGC